MHGFSKEFRDPVHYILDITERIWEGRGIELIRDWYASDGPVRTPHGRTDDVEQVVEGTRATLLTFPDRELLGEDVIIGEKASGFYSSHRVRSTATHLGGGMFGEPTGRPMTMLTIADCLCRDNQVVDEWLVRDQAAIALQLGLDVRTMGRTMGGGAPQSYVADEMAERWADPDGLTVEGDADLAQRAVDAYSRIFGGNEPGAMATTHDRALRHEGPSGTLSYGRDRAGALLGSIFEAMPNGRFTANHAIGVAEDGRPPRVALRWSYVARHAGGQRYGDASNVDLALLGVSHFEFRNDRILNEWMVTDELSIHAQIAAAGR